ncbi:MAG TPA: hypothetical protein VFQ65_09310 [Kofleriaceae bacterium]|nr:hypothetical protein [Kofleriaceae bacterium]
MSVRHLVLGLIAAAVLIAGVYLFIEVRSTSPAIAAAPPSHPNDPGSDEPHPTTSDRVGTPPVVRPADHVAGTAVPPPSVASDEESSDETAAALDKPNPKIDAIMDQANKHYDKGEWEDAKLIAAKVLTKQPTNIRMMRIMVSASCVDGDTVVAQKWFDQLPKADREQMKVRCDKYAVTFKEPAQ